MNVCILVIWDSACWVHKAHGPVHNVKAHKWLVFLFRGSLAFLVQVDFVFVFY